MKRSSSSSCSSNSSSSYSNECENLKKPKLAKKRAKKESNGNGIGKGKNKSSGKRSSIYRGVTRHRWTGRFEAHLWDKTCWNNVQNKKGRQVYLGAYDSEDAAARTYDLAALKYWGPTTTLNFSIDLYTKEIEEMEKVTREEYLASLRRQSSGFSRGVSKYRGVARHHHNGRWEARIGRVFGNKYLYLGTYKTQEEAAAAYDMAAIEYRGANAVTNFDISNYLDNNSKKTISVVAAENPDPSPRAPPSPSSSPYPYQNAHQAMSPHGLMSCLDESSSSLVNDLVVSWGFLDAGFAPLPVPDDLPLDKHSGELLDFFDDVAGFEDDIGLIFGSPDSIDLFDPSAGGGGGSTSNSQSPSTSTSTLTNLASSPSCI